MAASGRSGDTTHGHNGVNSRWLLALRRLEHPNANVQERKYLHTPEVMRACITEGICPFCGEKFKNVASHTNRTHGVDKDELKAAAGIPKSLPACSPEFSQKLSDLAKDNPNPERVKRMQLNRHGDKRKYSDAGRAVQRAKLEACSDPQRVGAINSERRLAAVADRDAEILRRIKCGEFLEQIAEDLGIHSKTARTALRRMGYAVDLRTTAANHPERIRKADAALKGAWQRKAQETAIERLCRWQELGANWDAIATLAREWDMSEKSVRAFLRGHGAAVPDGRTASGQAERDRRLTEAHR